MRIETDPAKEAYRGKMLRRIRGAICLQDVKTPGESVATMEALCLVLATMFIARHNLPFDLAQIEDFATAAYDGMTDCLEEEGGDGGTNQPD